MNQIKISQSTEEILLSINVTADIAEVIEELNSKLPKLNFINQIKHRLE